MTLVTDTFAANLNPSSKEIVLVKELTVTPKTSGAAVTQTVNFYNADAPFAMEVTEITVFSKTLTTANFDGTGGAVSIIFQRSDEVPASPNPTLTRTWDTLVASTNIKAFATDALCFRAPDSGAVIDRTYASIPKHGSLRATLSGQVENTYSGAGSLIEVVAVVKLIPTEVKHKKYF